jgi:hypothetical protein
MSREDDADDEQDGWGVAPPYGAYRRAYSSYDMAQFGSVGSGLLGGWSAVSAGGAFAAHAPAEDELREEHGRHLAHLGAGTPPSTEGDYPDDHARAR